MPPLLLSLSPIASSTPCAVINEPRQPTAPQPRLSPALDPVCVGGFSQCGVVADYMPIYLTGESDLKVIGGIGLMGLVGGGYT